MLRYSMICVSGLPNPCLAIIMLIAKIVIVLNTIISPVLQEGLLDIELVMTDDTSMALRDVSPAEYYLGVKSLEPRVIAFAPSQEARSENPEQH